MMKKIFGLLIMAFLLVGCGSKAASIDIPGQWDIVKTLGEENAVFDFKEDNTFILNTNDSNVSGEYEVHHGEEAVELVGLNLDTFNPTNSNEGKVEKDDIIVIVLLIDSADSSEGFLTDRKVDKLILVSDKKDGQIQLTGFSGVSGYHYALIKK